MFEALFILTTIDSGTRVGRFLIQEALGKIYAPFARPDWIPGAFIATASPTHSSTTWLLLPLRYTLAGSGEKKTDVPV